MKRAEAIFYYTLIGSAIAVVITLVLLTISLPFALLGVILLLAANIFTTVGISYFGSVVVGLAAYAIGHLIGR